jgi:hypothetical protein
MAPGQRMIPRLARYMRTLTLMRQATRLVTASEDDTSPVIMVWDLRNARAPEKVLGPISCYPTVD